MWAPYNDLWRSLRRFAVVELFSSKSLQNSSIVREQEIYNILSHFMKIGNREVDLKYWFTLLTFNMTTRLVAGDRCVGDKDVGMELGKRFVEGLKEKFLRSSLSNLCDYVPILRWIDYRGMHKDPKVWEEPDKFKPESFEGEREGFKFVPFGIERKACPSANMGVWAIFLALGSLVQCFELEEVPEKKA
ncbi:Cytochrome P450 81C13 [Camellia lanceoleosa]|uniref:Cytochrome P450 81C13 n=1 Tax=Camellia lanceoleosa TaxID=1840588 RepID=A0ACC0HUZ0_9ERIC|nr:Cytochrome P450 81C13 [Camellia lanceoleosa]